MLPFFAYSFVVCVFVRMEEKERKKQRVSFWENAYDMNELLICGFCHAFEVKIDLPIASWLCIVHWRG
jgi:hypothetical protein